jgi:hypothetical protein
MLKKIKTNWERFRNSVPGQRFQKRYHRRQNNQKKRSSGKKIALMVGGATLIGVGIVFLFIPGSGWAMIFTGSGMIAGESLKAAKALDKTEIKVRGLIRAFNKKKKRTKDS